MEDEFLLFVIASFVEKFFIFFRISRNNSSSFFFIVVVVYSRFFPSSSLCGEWKKRDSRSYFVSFRVFLSLFLAFAPPKKDVSSR